MQDIKYSPAPEYLAKLQHAIQEAHGCQAAHETTWMGVEHVGPLLWSGSAEIFRLQGCPEARRAFAWSKVEGQQLHCYVVLEDEEVTTAREAVRHVLSGQCAELEEAQLV